MDTQIQKDKSPVTENAKSKSNITFFKNAPVYNDINMESTSSPETEITDNREVASDVDSEIVTPEKQMSSVEKMMSTIDDNIQQMELTDSEQIETTVNKYIKLLDIADKYYIKYQYVYDNGEKYIQYLKSPEYVKYNKELKMLESKYSNNKRYTVEVTKKNIVVYKKDTEGNTDKSSKIDDLKRPTYINLIDIFDKTHKNITQTRLKLKALYTQFINKPFITHDVKNKFIKQRDSMITKLNDFYSIQYYYNKVNGIVQTDKIISLPKMKLYYSENKQEVVPRLISKNISVPAEELQLLYSNGATKLELYNKIKEMLITEPDKKKEIKELIKKYINFDEEQQRDLLHKIEKKKNHQTINYIVVPADLEMPVDNSILSPRDMRPFFAKYKKTSSDSNKELTLA